MNPTLDSQIQKAKNFKIPLSGIVTQIVGALIESIGPKTCLGEICHLFNAKEETIPCEVVGFKDNKVLLMSLGEMDSIAPGAEVYPTGKMFGIPVSESLCGRVIDAFGHPIDGKGPINPDMNYPVMASPPKPMERQVISQILPTGIKAIDATCTIGHGQRIGIFSGAGLGKSILLGMIARMSQADIKVIALIGERGKEVREFIERDLGPEGLSRSVVMVVTSEQAALLRQRGAHGAMAIAEYFRDLGKNVLFIMDSLSRYAGALREVGLAVGEPPTTRGYTPSVFAMLPKLLERAGASDKGVITGIYSIFAEGDDLNDPLVDTLKGLLDGHIVLSRQLAESSHYPAIDILNSLSRSMLSITTPKQYERAAQLRSLLQVYKESEDLIHIGAYAFGSNPKIDQAITSIDSVRAFLKQGTTSSYTFEETEKLLKEIIGS